MTNKKVCDNWFTTERIDDGHEALSSQPGWVDIDHFDCLPFSGFTAEQYTFQAAEPTQILQEGDVLDLGEYLDRRRQPGCPADARSG